MKRTLVIAATVLLLQGADAHARNETLWIWGGKYVGEVRLALPHGHGTWERRHGLEKYVGKWKDGKRHGQGKSEGGDNWKSTYVGEWRNDKKHGYGTYTWSSNKKKYVGEWKYDKQDGQGTFTWGDGNKYVGEYRNGLKNGQGTYTWASGAKYVGKWKNDKRNGLGTYAWANGTKYLGEYKDNRRWEGLQISSNGALKHTYSKGEKCDGCAATQLQLAIASEIDSDFVVALSSRSTTYCFKQDSRGSAHQVYKVHSSSCGSGHEVITKEKYYELRSSSGPALTVVQSESDSQPTQTAAVDKSALDLEFWKSIKESNDPDMFRAYLRNYPTGAFVDLAKIKLKNLGGDAPVAPSIPNLDYGNYHALVIGNNNYRHLSDLETAINDANAIGRVLENDYGFAVKVLTNATRTDILDTFSQYRRKVSAKDNLLIYFAGHGHLDRDMDEGYWLPIDAVEDSFTNWISNSSIISSVRGMQAKHVMVVADSCFSGTLVRAVKITPRTPGSLQKFVNLKARTALTSGGIEPVTDVGGGQHSVFARALLSLLEKNPGVMNGQELFVALRRQVQLNADQIPEYGDIRKAGHDGGDFLFVRQ